MEKLHVSTETLHTVSAESAEILAGIKERIAFIRITEARMNGEWKGDAHDSFDASFQSGLSRLEDQISRASALFSSCEDAGQTYEICENEVLALVNSSE